MEKNAKSAKVKTNANQLRFLIVQGDKKMAGKKIFHNGNLNDKIAVFVLLLFIFLVFSPGFYSIFPIDRIESSFALKSKQMLDRNSIWEIHENNVSNKNTYIGTHWLQIASAKFFGNELVNPIWIYRIPSLLGSLVAALATYWCARAFVGCNIALLASLLFSSTLIINVFVRLADNNSLLVATIVIAQGALARIWIQEKVKRQVGLALIFWLSVSASFLIKGPVGFMIILITILCLFFLTERRWIHRLMPLFGSVVSFMLVISLSVINNMNLDNDFQLSSITREFLGGIGHGVKFHGPPPFTHLLTMQFSLWPLSVIAIFAFPTIIKNWKNPKYLFFLSWLVPTWLALELSTFKQPQFVLPIIPAISIIVAITLGSWNILHRVAKILGSLFIVLIPTIIVIFSVGLPIYLGDNLSIVGIILCSFGVLTAFFAARQIFQPNMSLKFVIPAIFSATLTYAGFFGMTLSSLSSLSTGQHLFDKITEVVTCSFPKIASSGFKEPSVKLLSDVSIEFMSVDEIAIWLRNPGCNIAVVEENQLFELLRIVYLYEVRPAGLAMVKGFNYSSGGSFLHLYILQSNNVSSGLYNQYENH